MTETDVAENVMSRSEAERLTQNIHDQLLELQQHSDDLMALRRKAPREQRSKSGSIYFIQAGVSRAIKVGFARDVDARLKTLQIGCPEELSVIAIIPGTRSDEAFLHKHFAASHLRGEWFHESSKIRQYIWRYRK